MAQYRKKPVVIEAIIWDGENLEEVLSFTGKSNFIEVIGNIYEHPNLINQ